jgi:hypothetical protein
MEKRGWRKVRKREKGALRNRKMRNKEQRRREVISWDWWGRRWRMNGWECEKWIRVKKAKKRRRKEETQSNLKTGYKRTHEEHWKRSKGKDRESSDDTNIKKSRLLRS